ncbi:MAG TPA: DinB family protein, partial [Flavisolibacter sp.]|nr:DinB family protein [Flavisolibacter sp.]
MSNAKQPEVWLRGQLPGISPFLQPVAHALLQAQEEINELMEVFPDTLLWERPAGVASPGFHLQHLKGVLDRLFT